MINVALIGVGAIADTHIQAFQSFSDRCQIVALVDRDPNCVKTKRERYNLPLSEVGCYDSWQMMLAHMKPDLAAICLPPFVHADAAVDLLDAGVNVLLEKPMAPTLAECDRILDAADRSGKLLSVVAQNRYKNPMMKLKQVLDADLIGKIVHGQIDSYWWRGASYYDLWWRGTWEKEGGGCTLNHAVHHIDLFQWMMGKPDQVQAVVTNLNHANSEVEDFSTTVVRYADGRLGQITASLVHHGEEQRFTVQGERASVAAPWKVLASKPRANGFPDPDPVLAAEIDGFYVSLPDIPFDGHTGQIDNVLAALEGEQELLVDGEQGRNTIELVTAIYQSGFMGQPVSLPLSSDSPYYTREGVLANAPHFYEKTRSVASQAETTITLGSEYK
ncbi:MAG: Gfo/Idh/MocA family oxidoreductase [Caldilineales bacterium]|nr:Gfo/Idh/MocA family oxidoreductase [Caldilineales bacterium]